MLDVNEAMTRRDALRRAGIGGSMLALPALLAACGSDDSGGSTSGASAGAKGSDAEIDSISWGLLGSLLTLDTASGASADGFLVQALGLEGLVYLDRGLKLQPLLAESWDVVSATEYRFTIRQGVTYWDGSPMRTEDVVATFERHMDPRVASQMAYYLAELASVKATGPNEVTLKLNKPDPFFLYVLPMLHITPAALQRKLGAKMGKPAGTKIQTMGTGPYRFTSFSAENGVEVERNETYWGEKPHVRRATLRTLANANTQLLAARSGEIDGIFGFDLQQAKQWDGLSNVKPTYTKGMRTIYLCFNMQKAPFDDVHVRRAIAHAADREGYVRAFLAGHGVAAGPTIVAEEQWGDTLASRADVSELYETLPNAPYDIDAAKQELAESRYPDGFSATISFPSHEAAAGKALVSLSESLKQIGIQLKVNEITSTKWAADVDEHANNGLFFMTGTATCPDPMQVPVYAFDSAGARKGGYNLANYVSPEMDKLIKKQAGQTDSAQRYETVKQVFEMSSEATPYMGLWFPDIAIALNTKYVYDEFNALYYANRAFLANMRAAA